jgi:hypothetical protein
VACGDLIKPPGTYLAEHADREVNIGRAPLLLTPVRRRQRGKGEVASVLQLEMFETKNKERIEKKFAIWFILSRFPHGVPR